MCLIIFDFYLLNHSYIMGKRKNTYKKSKRCFYGNQHANSLTKNNKKHTKKDSTVESTTNIDLDFVGNHNIIIELDILNLILNNMICPKCMSTNVVSAKNIVRHKMGWANKLNISCSVCS